MQAVPTFDVILGTNVLIYWFNCIVQASDYTLNKNAMNPQMAICSYGSHLLAFSGGVIPIILLIAVLATLSGCAIEKREMPLQQDLVVNYADHPLAAISYNRKDWPHWIDTDGDCQNTRQELLIATSKQPVQFKDPRHCTVIYGEWYGVYTGKTFTQASDVDIDHIVPLAHAHRHGAEKWTKAQRRTFANDFENLLVVSDSINRSKSDKAPHEWLPPLKSYWCEYGERWERIKEKYRLWYSKQERIVLNQLAETCLE